LTARNSTVFKRKNGRNTPSHEREHKAGETGLAWRAGKGPEVQKGFGEAKLASSRQGGGTLKEVKPWGQKLQTKGTQGGTMVSRSRIRKGGG